MGHMGFTTHLLTIDPNFLGHLSWCPRARGNFHQEVFHYLDIEKPTKKPGKPKRKPISLPTVDGSEIPNNHLGCIKPCKWWNRLYINWCRISAINSIIHFQVLFAVIFSRRVYLAPHCRMSFFRFMKFMIKRFGQITVFLPPWNSETNSHPAPENQWDWFRWSFPNRGNSVA